MKKMSEAVTCPSCFCFVQNRELQIMRKLDHCNIVRLRYFFYSSGDKVSRLIVLVLVLVIFVTSYCDISFFYDL